MSNFNRDVTFSEKMQPFIDGLYNKIYGDGISITRTKKVDSEGKYDPHILDKYFHIDTIITMENGITFTFQEKFLRFKRDEWSISFTIEYFQNKYTKQKGEFFSLCPQYYLHCYINESTGEIIKWMIINVAKFLDIYKDWKQDDITKKTIVLNTQNATFFSIPYQCIPQDCIYKSFNI